MLGTIAGAAISGAGMVLYGRRPGTGLAATTTGKAHALAGAIGMLSGRCSTRCPATGWTRIGLLVAVERSGVQRR
ncbi:MAG TPA: hypothetical protein VNK67_05205 [Burkholderiales bacterium]|nr:hypothetical protein [Burkholderiales bacterium]